MATTPSQLLADAQARIAELLSATPAADLERNLKALLAQTFQKLDLVTREEFEVERERLARIQLRLEALERKLEAQGAAATGGDCDTDRAAVAAPIAPPHRSGDSHTDGTR